MKRKVSSQFVCNQCGYESVQWFGKCPNCGSWNTMQEFKVQSSKFKIGERRKEEEETRPVRLSEIKSSASERISSGIEEFDRVLGGPSAGSGQAGFVPGSVILLAGEPGVGKSTLLLKIAESINFKFQIFPLSDGIPPKAVTNFKLLYVSGEESVEQVKIRAERMGVKGENLLLLAETNVERVIEEVSRVSQVPQVSREEAEKVARDTLDTRGTLLIVDSVQTLWSEEIEGSPGSISQVKGCAQKLIEFAKKNRVVLILVGHVTKEGEVAGPMILSHMVDCVLFLEGERFTELRLLRGLKNRFGPTDEVGVFKMAEKGMEEVKDPSGLFLEGFGGDGGIEGKAGNAIVCAMEGTRPMLLEIQALVTQSALVIPRRVVSGVDYNRVLLLAAVLQKNLSIPLYNQDIYVKVGGGFKVNEPAADLGICLAIISSLNNKPVDIKVCVFGEVGLLGEVRRVSGEEKRIKEAKKLGFTKILSSGTVRNLREAVKAVGN